MKAEILARFSAKTIAWAGVWILLAAWTWDQPFLHGRHVLDGRAGSLWPLAALGSIVMGPWAFWLLLRALFPGSPAIVKQNDQFVCFLPWKTTIYIRDIQSIQVSEYGSAIGLSRRIVSGQQVEVLLHNGKAIKIRTALLKDPAQAIATRMTAALPTVLSA